MAFDLSQLSELEFDNVGTWPASVRVAAHLAVFVLVLGLGYYFDTSDQSISLDAAQNKELKLKRDFESKYRRAANLDAYKLQMSEMKEAFKHLLQQLPARTEIPGLIDDISFSQAAAGLDIKAGKLQEEKKTEFYIEKPFSLQVTGNYHSIGKFVSRVASLPRIVTLHDFDIEIADKSKQLKPAKLGVDPILSMKIDAKTYRYDQGGK